MYKTYQMRAGPVTSSGRTSRSRSRSRRVKSIAPDGCTQEKFGPYLKQETANIQLRILLILICRDGVTDVVAGGAGCCCCAHSGLGNLNIYRTWPRAPRRRAAPRWPTPTSPHSSHRNQYLRWRNSSGPAASIGCYWSLTPQSWRRQYRRKLTAASSRQRNLQQLFVKLSKCVVIIIWIRTINPPEGRPS